MTIEQYESLINAVSTVDSGGRYVSYAPNYATSAVTNYWY